MPSARRCRRRRRRAVRRARPRPRPRPGTAAEHRRRDQREVVRPWQVRAVEPSPDRERERDEADRPEVAHDPHGVGAEEPRREVVRSRPEHGRPDHDARQELPDHRRLPEPPADEAADVRSAGHDRDREECPEQLRRRHEEHRRSLGRRPEGGWRTPPALPRRRYFSGLSFLMSSTNVNDCSSVSTRRPLPAPRASRRR